MKKQTNTQENVRGVSLLRKYFDRSPDSVRALLHSTVFDLTPFSFQDIAILAGCQAVFVDLDQKYVKVKRVIPSGSNDQLVFGDTIKVWRLHPSSTVSFLPVQPANKRPHLRRPPINYTNYHCTVEVVPTPPLHMLCKYIPTNSEGVHCVTGFTSSSIAPNSLVPPSFYRRQP